MAPTRRVARTMRCFSTGRVLGGADILVERSKRGLAGVMVFVLGGCAASGFQVERSTPAVYEPSVTVEVLRQEPRRSYVTVAKFNGIELALCSRDEPYCTLRAQARA